MLLHSIEAVAFGTNCYIVAPHEGGDCVIIDPGIGVADRVASVLKGAGLRPAAVLLTHGHLDHVYDVPVLAHQASASGSALPSYIHTQDRYRLRNPLGDLDRAFVAMLEAQVGRKATWTQPADVVEVVTSPAQEGRGHARLRVADLDITVTHAPGHTEGSVLFELADLPEGLTGVDGMDRTVLSGDVLFAGSIGRCDLPGGDPQAMTRSLRDAVLPLPDSTLVLPGHGPLTTMAVERTSNPYLRALLV